MENVIPQTVAQPVTTPAPVVPSTTVPIVPATVVKVAVPEPAKAPEPTKVLHPMPTCSCWLKMDKTGSNVLLHDVTPAQMLFLVAEHHINAGGQPIHDITNEVVVDREDQVEFDRLRMKYHPDKIRTLYPGPMPKLPSTFKQAMDLGVGIKLASKNLMDFSVR